MQILSYGWFYDFPHGLYANYKDHVFDLESEFNDDLDDFADFFTVCAVPGASVEDFYTGRFHYNNKTSRAYYDKIFLGTIPVADVTFDATRRKSFRSPRFETMADRYLAEQESNQRHGTSE